MTAFVLKTEHQSDLNIFDNHKKGNTILTNPNVVQNTMILINMSKQPNQLCPIDHDLIVITDLENMTLLAKVINKTKQKVNK